MKKKSKIQVRKDTERNLKSFVIDVKYTHDYQPIFIHYELKPVKFLTNIKGIYRYRFEINFFDTWNVEIKKISVFIDAHNNYEANKWIKENLTYYPIDDLEGKVINLYHIRDSPTSIQTTLDFIDVEEVENLADLTSIIFYKWEWECWKCKEKTPVASYCFVYITVHLLGSVPKLDDLLAQEYSFISKIYRKDLQMDEVANLCIHCGALQGQFYIMEWLMEMIYCNLGTYEDNIIPLPSPLSMMDIQH